MNSCNLLVKLLSFPYQTYFNENISVVQVQVQFANLRNRQHNDQFEIFFWGALGVVFMEYYREGDFVIIEGCLSFDKVQKKDRFEKNSQFLVLRIFPFILVED